MNIRLLVLAAPLLLSGCSLMGSYSPLNWFSSTSEVTDSGVGGITATTPMNEVAIKNALNHDYRIRSGMEMHDSQMSTFYQVMEGEKPILVVKGANRGSVQHIEVLNTLKTAWGVSIGTPFNALYKKAYGACQKGSGDNTDGVVCRAKQSRHVSYVFSGSWSGPKNLIPSDDTLQNWHVSKIIWQSNPQ